MVNNVENRSGIFFHFILFAIITTFSIWIRWAWSSITVGLMQGTGVEEAFRLSQAHLYSPERLATNIGPIPIWVGHFLSRLFPDSVYITRWISFAVGILSPGIVYLVLRRISIVAAFCGAFALLICPHHIYFSTVGIAEAISFFFVLLMILFLEETIHLKEKEEWGKARLWSIGAVIALSAACLTRFETWILVPVVFLFAVFFFRKIIFIWLLVFAVPIAWLTLAKVRSGNWFSSANLVGTLPFEQAYQNTVHAVHFLFQDIGLLPLSAAAIGIAWLASRKKWIFPLCWISLTGATFAALILGKVIFEEKYIYSLNLFLFIFAGVGLGFLSHLAWSLIFQKPKEVSKPGQGAIAAVTACLMIFLITASQLGAMIDRTLETEHVNLFRHEQTLLEKLPVLRGHEKILLLTSLKPRGYLFIYSKPDQKTKFAAPMGPTGPLLEGTTKDILRHPETWGYSRIGLVVTEPFAEWSPKDNLARKQVIGNVRIERIGRVGGFFLYLVSNRIKPTKIP